MARKFPQNYKEEKLLNVRSLGWIRGLNTLVSNTQIKANELSDSQDIQLVEDGKIQCPRDGQSYYGNTTGSRVTGLFPFYLSTGAKSLVRTAGTHLQKLNTSTSDWDNVTGATYTNNLPTSAVTAYDKLYISNGTDNLSYYDGSTITTFSSIAAPTISSVTRTGGSTGSTTFSYKLTAVTAVGETSPSVASTQALNQSSLDASHTMTVAWSAVTSAIGYNIYGRKDGDWAFLKFLEGNSTTSYIDNGSDTPSAAFTPPEGNSTGGQKGKYIAVYKDSLFIFGDPANPSRLYYSGGGDHVQDFTIGGGGGFIDISKNDGQLGTGMVVFKNALLVFKEDSLYQFNFTSEGLPQIVQVNPAIGAIAPRSILSVENDVFFLSRRGVFTVGNEQGFAFDVLRTNEISAKVRSLVQTFDPTYIKNVAATYATVANKNLVIFSYTPSGSTTNSKALVYDRERLAWYPWTNIQANCWTTYIDSEGAAHVLYGDDSSGYVKEILTGSDDFGSAISGSFSLKAESFDALERYKTLKNIAIVLRKPAGAVTLTVTKDGVQTSFTQNIGTISPSINFAHYRFKEFLFGESFGSGVSEADNMVVRRVRNLNLLGRSFMLTLSNNGSGSFTLLETFLEGKYKSQHFYASGEVVN